MTVTKYLLRLLELNELPVYVYNMYSVIFLIENTNVGPQVEKAANVSLHTHAHASQRTRSQMIIELKKQLEAPVHLNIVFGN